MNEIQKLREQIDAIDNQIKQLLLQRFSVATQIGEHKKAQNVAVCDLNREQAVIDAALKDLSGKQRECVEEVYRAIIKNSKKLQE